MKRKRKYSEQSMSKGVSGILYDPPLCSAAEEGNIDKINDLLQSEHDPKEGDYLGSTPLHQAVKKNHKSIIKVLVRNVDVNEKDSFQQTPLFLAKDKLTLKLLRKAGARFTVQDMCGHVPAYYFVGSRGRAEMARYAIEVMVLENFEMERPNLPNKKMKDYWEKCSSEIERMKGKCIAGTSYTFYSILESTDTCDYPPFAANKDVAEVLKAGGYKSEFPIYGDEIGLRYEKKEKELKILIMQLIYFSIHPV